jgi:hypothetical protein
MTEEKMSHKDDDNLTATARQLSTDISPGRDLWPGIAEAIEKPAPRRSWVPLDGRTPMFAQAAAVMLLIGASSSLTYVIVKEQQPQVVPVSTDLIFEQTSFANRYSLGPGFQEAREALVDDLEIELARLSPESRVNVETNLKLIHDAISEMNDELEQDPNNILLQEQLLRAYREELALLRRVSGLTRNIMMRNDI